MKKFYLLVLVQITCIYLFAQDRKTILGISAGPCCPTGTFNEEAMEAGANSGCARMGLNVNGYLRHMLTKGLAFELKGFFNSNKIDTRSFADDMNRVYGEEVASWNFYWNLKGLLAGVCASIDTGPKGSWDFWFLAGPSGLAMPISRLPSSYQTVEKIDTHRSLKRMVAFDLGSGFTSTISKHLRIISSAEYLGSRTTLEEWHWVPVGPIVPGQQRQNAYEKKNSITFKYSVLNITIGLGFML